MSWRFIRQSACAIPGRSGRCSIWMVRKYFLANVRDTWTLDTELRDDMWHVELYFSMRERGRVRERERSRENWWWINVIGGGCRITLYWTLIYIYIYSFYDLVCYTFLHEIPLLLQSMRTRFFFNREILFLINEMWRSLKTCKWNRKSRKVLLAIAMVITLFISVNTHTRNPSRSGLLPSQQQLITFYTSLF